MRDSVTPRADVDSSATHILRGQKGIAIVIDKRFRHQFYIPPTPKTCKLKGSMLRVASRKAATRIDHRWSSSFLWSSANTLDAGYSCRGMAQSVCNSAQPWWRIPLVSYQPSGSGALGVGACSILRQHPSLVCWRRSKHNVVLDIAAVSICIFHRFLYRITFASSTSKDDFP